MAAGLTAVRSAVSAAAERAGRDVTAITIVAISKEASDDAIERCMAAGMGDFGENRAQALAARAERLPDTRWHFVGRLQRNKVSLVHPVVTLLHSLDRPALAEAWAAAPGRAPSVLVQVNVAGEEQKAGVDPSDAEALVHQAIELGLNVRGLMTMAPLTSTGEASRPVFASLRQLRDRLRERYPGVTELSMGMSGDYEVAVEEGATILRVGRAIFASSGDQG